MVLNLSFFLLLNINPILKKVENQTVAGPQCSLLSVNVDQQLVKTSSFWCECLWRCTLYRYSGARTAADRMCAVAWNNDISSKADCGDIFIRAAACQIDALSRILLKKKKSECDVTYGQVWWPILVIRALLLTHSKCTHTAVNTHTPWTHTRSSGQPFMLRRPGSSWGFGALLKGTSSWYWGWRESTVLSTYNSCWPETQTLNLSITSLTL